MWVSGGYDHRLKLWDIRSQECIMELDHGNPVESVLFFPSGSLLLSAGNFQSIHLYIYIDKICISKHTYLFYISNAQDTFFNTYYRRK